MATEVEPTPTKGAEGGFDLPITLRPQIAESISEILGLDPRGPRHLGDLGKFMTAAHVQLGHTH